MIWPFGGRDRAAALTAIGSLAPRTSAADASILLGYARSRDRRVAAAASARIESFVAELDPDSLFRLDREMRQVGYWRFGRNSSRCEPASCAVLGLQSFHPSGWVREAAVERLADLTTGEEIPFLLIRTNDWVEPVRERALRAVRARVLPARAARFADCFPLVVRMRSWRRGPCTELAEAIEHLLLSPGLSSDFARRVADRPRSVRRAAVAAAERHGAIRICENALTDPDPVVRTRATAAVLAHRERRSACSLAGELLSSPFSAVRLVALRHLIAACPNTLAARIETALFDTANAVRDLACFTAERRLGLDAGVLYRRVLDDEGKPRGGRAKLRAAILGLGSWGSSADAPRLVARMGSSPGSVQRACVRALAMLGLDEHRKTIDDAVASPHPGVSAEAVRTLCKFRAHVDPAFARRLVARPGAGHVRYNALGLVSRLGKWPGLIVALVALHAARRFCDDRLAERAARELGKWCQAFNRRLVRPTATEIAEARSLLDSERAALARSLSASLDEMIPRA